MSTSKPINEDQIYISPQQAAKLAGVALRTVRKWFEQKYNPLPSAKVGRRRLIKRHIFEQWIDSQSSLPNESQDIKSIVDNIFAEMKNN